MIAPDMTVRIEGPIPPREKLLTVPEVAEWLRVSPDWVRAHATGRSLPRLPCVRVGRSVIRFRESELNAWADRMGIAA